MLTRPVALQTHFLLPTEMLIVPMLKGELTFDEKHNTTREIIGNKGEFHGVWVSRMGLIMLFSLYMAG